MAKFELHYNQSAGYDNKVELDIRLHERPPKEDYQDMLDAIDKIDKIAKKFVVIPPEPEEEE